MKYSKEFERDFNWYLKQRHTYNFDGQKDYISKTGKNIIINDRNGVDGKKAFYLWDSQGKVTPTKHPNLLQTLLKIKGSINLHIKMYAEDLAECNWNKIEMRALCIKLKAPDWFRKSIEEQRWKYVKYDL